jgi:hypothetical protein
MQIGVIWSAISCRMHFVLRGVVSEWQRPLSGEDVERLVAAMRKGEDRLDI